MSTQVHLPTPTHNVSKPQQAQERFPILEEYQYRAFTCSAALDTLELFLRKWGTDVQIPPHEFEFMYTIMCRVGLADWLDWNLDGLYEETTRHPFDMARMRQLAFSYLPPESPSYRR